MLNPSANLNRNSPNPSKNPEKRSLTKDIRKYSEFKSKNFKNLVFCGN